MTDARVRIAPVIFLFLDGHEERRDPAKLIGKTEVVELDGPSREMMWSMDPGASGEMPKTRRFVQGRVTVHGEVWLEQ